VDGIAAIEAGDFGGAEGSTARGLDCVSTETPVGFVVVDRFDGKLAMRNQAIEAAIAPMHAPDPKLDQFTLRKYRDGTPCGACSAVNTIRPKTCSSDPVAGAGSIARIRDSKERSRSDILSDSIGSGNCMMLFPRFGIGSSCFDSDQSQLRCDSLLLDEDAG
jgi:hypothetical protein